MSQHKCRCTSSADQRYQEKCKKNYVFFPLFLQMNFYYQCKFWYQFWFKDIVILSRLNSSKLHLVTSFHFLHLITPFWSNWVKLLQRCWFVMRRRERRNRKKQVQQLWGVPWCCCLMNPDRLFFSRAVLKVPWSSLSVWPGNNPLVTGALLKGHYWMHSETRLVVNGQFGYTATRLELLGVMYRLSTCQRYKGGSRLCKCVCK